MADLLEIDLSGTLPVFQGTGISNDQATDYRA
jgi:hypothetical protein